MTDDDHNHLAIRDYEIGKARNAPRGAAIAATTMFLAIVAGTWLAAAVLF